MSPETRGTPNAAWRRELMMWLLGVAFAVALLLTSVVAMGGRIEAATWGLVVAAGAMIFALRSLYRMAVVLSQPVVEAVLEQEHVAASAGVRDLREERRRVLRAINELHFDFEMGKLSEEDYRTVRQGYELRAVEVMRALDAEPRLHPELEAELLRRGLLEEDASVEATTPAAVDEEPAAVEESAAVGEEAVGEEAVGEPATAVGEAAVGEEATGA